MSTPSSFLWILDDEAEICTKKQYLKKLEEIAKTPLVEQLKIICMPSFPNLALVEVPTKLNYISYLVWKRKELLDARTILKTSALKLRNRTYPVAVCSVQVESKTPHETKFVYKFGCLLRTETILFRVTYPEKDKTWKAVANFARQQTGYRRALKAAHPSVWKGVTLLRTPVIYALVLFCPLKEFWRVYVGETSAFGTRWGTTVSSTACAHPRGCYLVIEEILRGDTLRGHENATKGTQLVHLLMAASLCTDLEIPMFLFVLEELAQGGSKRERLNAELCWRRALAETINRKRLINPPPLEDNLSSSS